MVAAAAAGFFAKDSGRIQMSNLPNRVFSGEDDDEKGDAGFLGAYSHFLCRCQIPAPSVPPWLSKKTSKEAGREKGLEA